MTFLLFFAALFLAYSNGANDNFKGVATLYGSKTVSYRTAITIATVATFAGSVCAIFLAEGLIASFSGKGLVPQGIAGSLHFLTAVGLGAGITVLLATFLGFPISTTHSLVGGLVGAGLVAVGNEVDLARLSSTFMIPLLVSPFLACLLGAITYQVFTRARKHFNVEKNTCVCIGEPKLFSHALQPSLQINREQIQISASIDEEQRCAELYTDKMLGINLQTLLNIAHTFSAATVSFARGLNDTPKIAGLLVAATFMDIQWSMIAIAVGIALGGMLSARRVAETISNKITSLTHGQGFSANLVTGILVIFASKFGVPVSTTHVSVGAIFGISASNPNSDRKMIFQIILSWFVTLPCAMIFSATAYLLVGL